MPFFKLGNIVFNTDYVVKIVLTDDTVTLHFAASDVPTAEDQLLELTGDEATAFKEQWMRNTNNVTDLMPPRSKGIPF